MAKTLSRKRMESSINAGSMADIAFLLLIFFLVTTTILEDRGILVRLPIWTDTAIVESQPIKDRNVLSVKVNSNNDLMVEGAQFPIAELRAMAKEFIVNPSNRDNLAEKPTKAVISLQNDRGTKYETYIEVYNELKGAYVELWSDLSMKMYGIPYDEEMSKAMKKAIRSEIPFVISEAEPTTHGESL
ncbi:MAG: biopolymer transporter ExbD [Bacteroidota bacterium]